MINFFEKIAKFRINRKSNKFNRTSGQMPFLSTEDDSERRTILGMSSFQVIESYKQLRTNVMFAMSAKDINVVEFSSSFPG